MLIPGFDLPVLLSQTHFLIVACRGFEFAPIVSTVLVVFRLCQLARDIHKFPVFRWSLQTIMRVSFPLIALPFFFWVMYYKLHFWTSFMDYCPQTVKYYIIPLYSLAVAFFMHTYPIEKYVPPMFGVPTTLPCTAGHKRELARLQAMIDNANANNLNSGDPPSLVDVSLSAEIKDCAFCEIHAKHGLKNHHWAGCNFDYGNLPIPFKDD